MVRNLTDTGLKTPDTRRVRDEVVADRRIMNLEL